MELSSTVLGWATMGELSLVGWSPDRVVVGVVVGTVVVGIRVRLNRGRVGLGWVGLDLEMRAHCIDLQDNSKQEGTPEHQDYTPTRITTATVPI